MNPTIFASPTRREFFRNLTLPRIEPSFGKHAADWHTDELISQREQYRATGTIQAGFGKHRASRYPHSSYNVVEDRQRDQIKAERLARRNAA